jgi:hypothetical protein
MTRTRVILNALVIAVGTAVAYMGGDAVITVMLVVFPLVLVGSFFAAGYLQWAYTSQPPPRSRFFGMLTSSVWRKAIIGLVIGYIAYSRLLEEYPGLALPIIPRPGATAIVAWCIVVLLAPGIVYAYNVWRVRRAAERDDEGNLGAAWDVDFTTNTEQTSSSDGVSRLD